MAQTRRSGPRQGRPDTNTSAGTRVSPGSDNGDQAAAGDFWRDAGMHLGIDERNRAGQRLAAGDE
jgi:hypothetical protein